MVASLISVRLRPEATNEVRHRYSFASRSCLCHERLHRSRDWGIHPQGVHRRSKLNSHVMNTHSDRRNTPRRRTLKAAQIFFNNRRCVIDCTVRNLSTGGALLSVPNVMGVPDQFDLCLGRGCRSVRVVWKSDRTLGVVWTK